MFVVAKQAITLSETALTLNPGKSAKLTVTTLPENADEATLVWNSSADEIATVDAEGNVTAVAIGEAVIRVSVEGNPDVYAECTVRVEREAIPVTGIKLSQTSLTLKGGWVEQLTVTLLPEDADNVQLVWTSSDSSIASVHTNGEVVGGNVGVAIIRVSVNTFTQLPCQNEAGHPKGGARLFFSSPQQAMAVCRHTPPAHILRPNSCLHEKSRRAAELILRSSLRA